MMLLKIAKLLSGALFLLATAFALDSLLQTSAHNQLHAPFSRILAPFAPFSAEDEALARELITAESANLRAAMQAQGCRFILIYCAFPPTNPLRFD